MTNRKAVNILRSASQTRTFMGKTVPADRVMRKFPEGEADQVREIYDAIRTMLVDRGFIPVRAPWVRGEMSMDHCTTFVHPRRTESFRLERRYLGCIPGDRAQGYRGTHQLILAQEAV